MSEQTHTAAAYEITLSVRGKPNEMLPLDNFDGDGGDFLRYIASFVKSMPPDRLVKEKSRSFGEPSSIQMAGCTYSCRLVSGASGIRSEFRSRGEKTGFVRTDDDVEEMRFGVFLLRPPNGRVGFLIVERIGNRTLAREFRTLLLSHFRSMYPNVIPSLSRTAHTDAWRQAEEQGNAVGVREVTIVHRGIEAGQMEQFGIAGATKKVGEYRQMLRFNDEPESAGILKKLRGAFFAPTPGISARGGTVAIDAGEDGGADEGETDDVSELIAAVRFPGQPVQHIRCSGARPPAIRYPLDVGPGVDDGDEAHNAFRSGAKTIAKGLAGETDCRLEQGWDTSEWEDADTLPTWEVTGFGTPAEHPGESEG